MIEKLINSYCQINLNVREITAAVNKTECFWLTSLLGHFIKQGSNINIAQFLNSPSHLKLSTKWGVPQAAGPLLRAAGGNPRAGLLAILGLLTQRAWTCSGLTASSWLRVSISWLECYANSVITGQGPHGTQVTCQRKEGAGVHIWGHLRFYIKCVQVTWGTLCVLTNVSSKW